MYKCCLNKNICFCLLFKLFKERKNRTVWWGSKFTAVNSNIIEGKCLKIVNIAVILV